MTDGLRIGYSSWMYFSDIEKDTPGGANFYIADLILELNKRNHEVSFLQVDRDLLKANELRQSVYFGDFLSLKRRTAYTSVTFDMGLPELDILILEWRWPILGRNTPEDRGVLGFTQDLDRQRELLEHYSKTNTTIIIWDQDHKVTSNDETEFPMAHVIETAVSPRALHTVRNRVHIPFDPINMLDLEAGPIDPEYLSVYVGNNYDRDTSIDKYINPIANSNPGKVHFVGNWRKYPEVFSKTQTRWPNIEYHDRISKDQFKDFYGKALTCPLIAKDTYYKSGFLTARFLEALYFRCVPVGFSCFTGIKHYLIPNLVVDTSDDYQNLITDLSALTDLERESIFQYQFSRLDPFKPSHFVDTIESLYGKLPQKVHPLFRDKEYEEFLSEPAKVTV